MLKDLIHHLRLVRHHPDQTRPVLGCRRLRLRLGDIVNDALDQPELLRHGQLPYRGVDFFEGRRHTRSIAPAPRAAGSRAASLSSPPPSLLDLTIQLAGSRVVVAQVEGIGGEPPAVLKSTIVVPRVIDFRYRDRDGREQRYRRDAHTQTAAGARAETARLMEQAASIGSLKRLEQKAGGSRSPRFPSLFFSSVGEGGFEPPTTSTQSSCTTRLCDSPCSRWVSSIGLRW